MDDLATRLDAVEKKGDTSSTSSSTSEQSEASEDSSYEEDEEEYSKKIGGQVIKGNKGK